MAISSAQIEQCSRVTDTLPRSCSQLQQHRPPARVNCGRFEMPAQKLSGLCARGLNWAQQSSKGNTAFLNAPCARKVRESAVCLEQTRPFSHACVADPLFVACPTVTEVKEKNVGGEIACDACRRWFHLRFLDLSESFPHSVEDYFCPACIAKSSDSLYNKKPQLKNEPLAVFFDRLYFMNQDNKRAVLVCTLET